MENVLLCNTQSYLSLSNGQLNFCEFKRHSYAVWWVMVLQIKTFLLVTGFTSHFSHNLILLWFLLLSGLSLLLLGLFVTCKTYRHPFWVKGSHPIYIALYPCCSFSKGHVLENVQFAGPTAPGQKGRAEISQNTFSGRQISAHSPWR